MPLPVFVVMLAPDGHFDPADFRVAFCFPYVSWAFGLVSLWSSRRLTRAGLAAEGTQIDPLPHAIARHWRHRGGR